LAAETPDALYNTDNFKKMTGQDMIRGRRLYQEGFKFQNYAKLVFAANELPETDDYTHAFFRRIMLVDCPYRFTKDPNDGHKNADPSLPESILDEEELSGLLNWALDGLNRLLNQGGFSETKTRKEIKERWIRETDPERGFIEKFIETDYNTFLVRSDIHEAYKEYCEEHELEAKDQGPLTKAINSTMTSASKYTPQVDGKRQKSFKNIKLTGEFSEYNRQLSEQGKEGKQVDDNQGKLDDVTDVTVKNDKKRLEKENRSNKSSSENPVTRVTDEVENLGNPNCEVCEEEMDLEKEAERKVSRNGEDLWLCESCLQDMGYETEEGGTSQ
jgi:putative DNA primase/helicase